jgi:hypothetical protein
VSDAFKGHYARANIAMELDSHSQQVVLVVPRLAYWPPGFRVRSIGKAEGLRTSVQMLVGNWFSRRIGGTSALMRRVAASALLASWVTACHQSYHPVPAATVDSGSPREYGRLLVVTRDGYELELVRAFIRPDSVVGFEKQKDRALLQAREPPRRLAFARDQIVRVESYERDAPGTAKENRAPQEPEDKAEAGRQLICVFSLGTRCPPKKRESPRTEGKPVSH